MARGIAYRVAYEQLLDWVIENANSDAPAAMAFLKDVLNKNDIPTKRTVERYWTEIKANRNVTLDSPFEWQSIEKYGLPTEAGRFLLDVWSWLIATEIRHDHISMALTNPHPSMPIEVTAHWPYLHEHPLRIRMTGRQARWVWRTHCSSTNMPRHIMWGISWRCAYRERTHELFGTPLDLTDIQGFIAFQSWLDDDHEKTYLEAIDAGKITPLSGDLESLEKIAELDRDDIEGWLIVPSMTRNAFRAYEVTAEETQ